MDKVKLISAEGEVFLVERRVACVSGTISNMLEGGFVEAEKGVIMFQEISSAVLAKAIEYMKYKYTHAHSLSDAPLPEFVIEPEIALPLLLASNFLHL